MRNNKGFSLIELIVAFAIFAIAGVAVCSFVVFGSQNYTTGNKEVKLQYEQQITVNQIRDIILETSKAISYDDTSKTLLVFSKDSTNDAKPYLVSKVAYDAEKSELYLNTENFEKFDGATSVAFSDSDALLADSIADFSVDLAKIDKGQVTLNITFKVDEREIVAHPVIKLRNVITDVTGKPIDDVYEEDDDVMDGFVASVTILRGSKSFAQGETDTIGLAGTNTATATYTARVNKKSFYEGDVDQSVTWDFGNETQRSKYASYISFSGGVVSVNVTGADTTIRQKIHAETFILKATSVADNTKSAKIKVKIAPDGVYPESITTTYTTFSDDDNGLLVYNFAHVITYTDKTKVDGDKVFELIEYSVSPKSDISAGCGFDDKIMDGKFLCNKAMEGKTFTVTTTVKQHGKDGIIKSVTTFTVGRVPDKAGTTKIKVSYDSSANRNDYCTMAVSWTKGAPTYGSGSTKTNYYCRFKFELEPGDCDKWSNKKKNTFNELIYMKEYSWSTTKKSEYMSEVGNQTAMIYCEPYLDWTETFSYKVKITPYICKTNSSKDEDWQEYHASEGDDQSVYKTVVIKPVTVTFTPAEINIVNSNGRNEPFSCSLAADVGIKVRKPGRYNDNQEYKEYITGYSKAFKPEFENILVNVNYVRFMADGNGIENVVIDNPWDRKSISGVRRYAPDWQKVLRPFYLSGSNTPIYIDPGDFSTEIRNYNNVVYASLKMYDPGAWKSGSTLPSKVEYEPYVTGYYDENGSKLTDDVVKVEFKYKVATKTIRDYNNIKIERKYYIPYTYPSTAELEKEGKKNSDGTYGAEHYKTISDVVIANKMVYDWNNKETVD